MRWDSNVVENYRFADSVGHGMHLYWSERPHGMDMAPEFNDHWIIGLAPHLQTITDNVNFAETAFRSDISYPAFFNHQLDPNANDPGDGTLGTGVNGVGDDWGTWGGWHRWDNTSITDQPNMWSVEAWLESNAVFQNDNCPHPLLTSDLVIRKPLQFKPSMGDMIEWKVEDASSLALLQVGSGQVGPDDLVTIQDIAVYPEDVRKVRITIAPQGSSTSESDNSEKPHFSLFPNPSANDLTVRFFAQKDETALIRILHASNAEIVQQSVFVSQGVNNIPIDHLDKLLPGIYFVQLLSEDGQSSRIWMKQE
jgi:hypothetical protein